MTETVCFEKRGRVMKTLLTIILVGSAILSPWVEARDYYVSSIRSGRSDSNSGTNPDAPWASMDKVVSSWSSLSAGDTVHLERGSQWNLSFSSDYLDTRAGGSASGGPITLRGDDYGSGAKPILKRTGGSGNCAFILITRSYVTVRDIELDGGNSDYGKNTSGMLILADGRDVSNAQILNMKIHNLGGSTTAYICGIWLASWTQNTTSDCLIEGNEVSDYAAHGLNHYSQGRMNRIVWRNNYVHNSYTGGRYPSANAAMQITSGGSDCVFEYNWLEDTTTTEGSLFGFGKYAGDTGSNTIRYNIITGSPSYGMIFTIDYSNMKLLYNVYGNLIMKNGKSGFAIHPYNSYASGTRFNVYNNTFYDNATGGDGSRSEMEIDQYCDNTTIDFANNLIVHRNTGNPGFAIDSGFSGSFSHRNNLFWHEGGTSRNIISAYGQSFTVSNARNFESSAQNADPLLSDVSRLPTSITRETGPVPNGLSLKDGSPAIGTGVDLGSAYAVDILQTSRTGSWSIGAYQAAGSVVPTADTESPVVALSSPEDGVIVSGSITLSAAASDDTGVVGVQFRLNGAALGAEDTSAPFSTVWNTSSVADGDYEITAVARDEAGNAAVSAVITVSVSNASPPPVDSEPPAVSVTAPTDGATVSGSVTLAADASDDTGVAGVQFVVNGAEFGAEDVSSPFSTAWNTTNTANGVYKVTAVARDAAGNASTSAVVTVTVSNSAPEPGAIISSVDLWQNQSFVSQNNRFAIEFDAVPSQDNMDGVFGVAQGNAADYDDLAVIVRFNDSGMIDVRQGDIYTSIVPVSYSAGSVCHFRVLIDISSHTYSVHVQVDGGDDVIIAQNYAFRASQSSVSSLDTLAVTAAVGSHAISNLTVIPAEEPAPPTGLKATPVY